MKTMMNSLKNKDCRCGRGGEGKTRRRINGGMKILNEENMGERRIEKIIYDDINVRKNERIGE